MKGYLYPLFVGLGIRLALAPFFMHGWDMSTIMLASNQFLSAVNPYTYVQQQSVSVAGGYYGFAYLPTALIVYAPFYWVYHAMGFASLPLLGWQNQVGQHLGLIYPDAFYFLTLMKIPVIVADCVAIALLCKRNEKLGWAYALSPYAIVITSVWGQFDPLVGVLLFVSYLAFDRSKAASGFAFGLSMMKLYTVVAAPAFLIALWKKPRDLLAFVSGAALANVPTFYYLFVDPSSFLYVLGFQGSRPVQGLNVYSPLTALNDVSLEASLSRIAVGILIVALAVATVMLWRRKVELKESVILLMLVYVVFAPVTNEQLLAALLPLGLLARNFSHKLTIFPLVFIAFNATYFYFAAPIFYYSQPLLDFMRAAMVWWVAAWGGFAYQVRYMVAGTMGVAALLLARSTFYGRLRLRLLLTGTLTVPERPERSQGFEVDMGSPGQHYASDLAPSTGRNRKDGRENDYL